MNICNATSLFLRRRIGNAEKLASNLAVAYFFGALAYLIVWGFTYESSFEFLLIIPLSILHVVLVVVFSEAYEHKNSVCSYLSACWFICMTIFAGNMVRFYFEQLEESGFGVRLLFWSAAFIHLSITTICAVRVVLKQS